MENQNHTEDEYLPAGLGQGGGEFGISDFSVYTYDEKWLCLALKRLVILFVVNNLKKMTSHAYTCSNSDEFLHKNPKIKVFR